MATCQLLLLTVLISMVQVSYSTALTNVKSLYLYKGEKKSGKVIEHTDQTDFQKYNGPKVVEFYSPYCGGCRMYKPHYVAVAADLAQNGVKAYAISCAAHKPVCNKFNIGGYPTIRAIPKGDTMGTLMKPHSANLLPDIYKVLEISAATNRALGEDEGEDKEDEGDEDDEDNDKDDEDNDKDDEEDDDNDEDSDGKDDDEEDDEDEEENDKENDKDNENEEANEEEGDKEEEEEDKEDDKEDENENENENEEEEEESDSNESGDKGETKNDDDDGTTATSGKSVPNRLSKYVTPGVLRQGRVPNAGAGKAALKERDMDKWREILERRKKVVEQRQKRRFISPEQRFKPARPGAAEGSMKETAKPGATNLMQANTPGTDSYAAKREAILRRIREKRPHRFSLRSSKTLAPISLKKNSLPFKVEPKKPGFARRQFEKVPLVRRAFRLSPEEALILDASLSFVVSLEMNVFMMDEILDAKKQAALLNWFHLLSVSLPPEWGLHALIDDLMAHFPMIVQSNSNLKKILKKHPLPRRTWSPSCQRTGGLTCGFWKLLHIMSIGVAEHRGGVNLINSGMVDPETPSFAPIDAADVLREYIAHFFHCTTCKEHFLSDYDQCLYRRCDRLSADVESDDPEDWKQMALWLWEVHNGVSLRIQKEKLANIQKSLNRKHLQTNNAVKIVQDKESNVKSLWPSVEACLPCFTTTGEWDENTVFEFLERTYWDAPDAKYDRLLTFKKMDGQDGTGGGFVWIMLICGGILVAFLRQHITGSSFHRNFHAVPTSISGIGNKLTDVMAGKQRAA